MVYKYMDKICANVWNTAPMTLVLFFLEFHASLQRYNFNFCHTTFFVGCRACLFPLHFKISYSLLQCFHLRIFFFTNSIVSVESFAFPLSPCLFPLSTKQRQISGVFMRCEQLEKFIDMFIRICMKMWKYVLQRNGSVLESCWKLPYRRR